MDLEHILNDVERQRRIGLVCKLFKEGMNHSDESVREGTAEALWSLAYLDVEKYTELHETGLTDESLIVRMETAESFRFVAHARTFDSSSDDHTPTTPVLSTEEFIDLYKHGLTNDDSMVRQIIAESLTGLIEQGMYPEFMTFYNRGINDDEGFIRQATAKASGALANHGNWLDEFLKLFKEMKKNPDDEIRRGTAEAVGALASDDLELFLKFYRRGLNSNDDKLVEGTARAIATLANVNPEKFRELYRQVVYTDWVFGSAASSISREAVDAVIMANIKVNNFLAIPWDRWEEFDTTKISADGIRKKLNKAISLTKSQVDRMGLYRQLCEGKLPDDPRWYIRLGTLEAHDRLYSDPYFIKETTTGESLELCMATLDVKVEELLLVKALECLLNVYPYKFVEFYKKGLQDNDPYVRKAIAKSLSNLAIGIDDPDKTFVSFGDVGSDFFITVLNSDAVKTIFEKELLSTMSKFEFKYYKYKESLISKLFSLAKNPDTNYQRLKELFDAGQNEQFAKSLDEAVKEAEDLCEIEAIKIPNYTITKKLGRGVFKKAYLAQSSLVTNTLSIDEVILLEIDPQPQGLEHIRLVHPNLQNCDNDGPILEKIKDIEFMAAKLNKVKNPYVAAMFLPVTGQINGKDRFFIPTMDIYEKSLEDILIVKTPSGQQAVKLSPEKALRYFYQICSGLDACHAKGITHKDLKYGNIGITKEDNILLSDFGCVGAFSEGANCSYHNPLQLRPPELAFPPDQFKPGVQADLMNLPEVNAWNAGAILYRMLTGKDIVPRPKDRADFGTKEYFKQNDEVCAQIRALTEEDIAKKVNDAQIDKEGGDLVKMCLRIDMNDRKGVLKKCIELSEKYNAA